MRSSLKGFISPQEENYITLLFGHAQPEGKEAGLEKLCKWYRKGFRLKNPHPIRQTLNALLYSHSPNVRRWALNAIALVGRPTDNLQATLDAIERNRGDQDILGAGVAALVALTKPDDILGLLKQIDIPLEGAPLLAAAQQTNVFTAQIAEQRVDPERADAPELRLATILIGLDKAPEHLFTLNHENSLMIGALNEHNDGLVAQYSVWAICESPKLSIAHLRTPLKDIDGRPDNVRGWIFQLIAATDADAEAYREYLLRGSEDVSEKARLGLATGLKSTYFEGLEEITVDWLSSELRDPVRLSILDHMAANCEKCPAYRDAVLSAYNLGGTGSLLRVRLEAAAQGTSLYAELKRIAIQSDNLSLFGETGRLTKGHMTMNITGTNINIGVLAGGDANVSGTVNATQHNVQQAQEALVELSKLLSNSNDVAIKDGQSLVSEAQKKPNRSTVEKVVGWMKAIKDAGNYAVAASASFGQIYDKLALLIQHLPHI